MTIVGLSSPSRRAKDRIHVVTGKDSVSPPQFMQNLILDPPEPAADPEDGGGEEALLDPLEEV